MVGRKIRLIISTLCDAIGLFSLIIFLNKLFRKKRTVILMYHRVFDLGDEEEFPFYLVGPDTKMFERQIEYLTKRYNLLNLDEFAYLYQEEKDIPPNTVIITIDDGYIDCYNNIFPILKKYNCPATMFLSTGYVNSNSLFWVDELAYWIKKSSLKILKLEGLDYTFRIEDKKDKEKTINTLIKIFKSLKEVERKEMMNRLANTLGVKEKVNANLNLTWEQVKEMSQNRISFGAHTVNHPILTRISDEEARREVIDSKESIEGRIAQQVTTFCYPSGESETFNEFHKRLLKENGFLCAVASFGGAVGEKSDLFSLERISVDRSDTMPLFKAKIAGIFEIKKTLEKVLKT
jgi:peptidoglycan/xylan/chitin deacetylase (PgdA/CDA1 family)